LQASNSGQAKVFNGYGLYIGKMPIKLSVQPIAVRNSF